MTPEEELRRLGRLIRQYETVWQTTSDPDQKERAARQLRELRDYRDKILAVHVIDRSKVEEPSVPGDVLAGWPLLRELAAADRGETDGDQEVRHVALYLGHFASEYLPFLIEPRLKLDFKHGLERDAFYRRFQDLQRKLDDWRDARRRLEEGSYNRELSNEIRTRIFKLKRMLIVEASRFMRTLANFANVLAEDAVADGVLCLNGDAEITFDAFEGTRLLAGRRVADALGMLGAFATEALDYLSVPELADQENESADRG